METCKFTSQTLRHYGITMREAYYRARRFARICRMTSHHDEMVIVDLRGDGNLVAVELGFMSTWQIDACVAYTLSPAVDYIPTVSGTVKQIDSIDYSYDSETHSLFFDDPFDVAAEKKRRYNRRAGFDKSDYRRNSANLWTN